MKMTIFSDVALYSLVGIALMMEGASASETSVNFYETTLRNIPEEKRKQTSVPRVSFESTIPVFE
jgi:hypothetical protein